MKTIQTDIFGITPEVGDIIIYNSPKYKGLVVGKCVGFSTSGLPELDIDKNIYGGYLGQRNNSGYYTPKTGFVVHKLNKTI